MCFQSPQSISQSPCEMNHPQDPQWGPYRERCPFTEPSFAHTLMKKKSSVKDSLSMFPQWGPCGERCFVSRASGLFIHSLSLRVPISPMKWVGGGNIWLPSVEYHMDRRPYIHWGVAWFPMGIVYDTAVSTPVPCSLQHDTIHFGLSRPELR